MRMLTRRAIIILLASGTDDVLLEVTPFWESTVRLLSIDFHFWDCWVDARNHDWNY